MGSRPLKRSRGKGGRLTANINTGARAAARAAPDKPAAVNYEWGLRRGRQAGEYAGTEEGGESTQRRCQTPAARGQAGVDLGVNHKHRQGNRRRAGREGVVGADPKTAI